VSQRGIRDGGKKVLYRIAAHSDRQVQRSAEKVTGFPRTASTMRIALGDFRERDRRGSSDRLFHLFKRNSERDCSAYEREYEK